MSVIHGKTVVCGVDSSTQSCTIVARHPDSGEVLDFGKAQHPKTSPPVSEQDPEEWWLALIGALSESGIDSLSIGSISIDGQGHGSVLLSEKWKVLRRAKLWNDTESYCESDELIHKLGVDEWIRSTGIVPVPAFTISKLLWFKRHEPNLFSRIKKILLPHDWINYRLTGEFFTDRSEASGTGYYSPAVSSWRTDLLRLVDSDIDWEPMLPVVSGPDDVQGRVSDIASNQTGLLAGIPVAPGCNDNSASALGLGLKPADVCISLGTSGTVFSPSIKPIFDSAGNVNGNADATGAFLPLVCTLNATKVSDWVVKLFGISHEVGDQRALKAPPNADRPFFIPYFDGERTPNLPQSSGSIHGLRIETTPDLIIRAAFEGVSLGIASGLDCLDQAGVDISGRVIVTGGGANSPAYVQFLADILKRPIWISTETRSAAMGAAIQAAAVFHGSTVEEIKDQWAPALAIGAEPRDGQSIDELRFRYRQVVMEEETRAKTQNTG